MYAKELSIQQLDTAAEGSQGTGQEKALFLCSSESEDEKEYLRRLVTQQSDIATCEGQERALE